MDGRFEGNSVWVGRFEDNTVEEGGKGNTVGEGRFEVTTVAEGVVEGGWCFDGNTLGVVGDGISVAGNKVERNVGVGGGVEGIIVSRKRVEDNIVGERRVGRILVGESTEVGKGFEIPTVGSVALKEGLSVRGLGDGGIEGNAEREGAGEGYSVWDDSVEGESVKGTAEGRAEGNSVNVGGRATGVVMVMDDSTGEVGGEGNTVKGENVTGAAEGVSGGNSVKVDGSSAEGEGNTVGYDGNVMEGENVKGTAEEVRVNSVIVDGSSAIGGTVMDSSTGGAEAGDLDKTVGEVSSKVVGGRRVEGLLVGEEIVVSILIEGVWVGKNVEVDLKVESDRVGDELAKRENFEG